MAHRRLTKPSPDEVEPESSQRFSHYSKDKVPVGMGVCLDGLFSVSIIERFPPI